MCSKIKLSEIFQFSEIFIIEYLQRVHSSLTPAKKLLDICNSLTEIFALLYWRILKILRVQ